MREIGYGDTKPRSCFFGFCGGPTAHPRSMAAVVILLSFKYRFRDQVSAQVVYSTGSGVTDGYASRRGSLGLTHRVTTVAVIAALETGGVHMGLGPALYSTRLDSDVRGRVHGNTKLGLLAAAGFEIPLSADFFLDLRIQRRFAGSAKIQAPEWLASSDVTASPVDFSHWYVGGGFGIRF